MQNHDFCLEISPRLSGVRYGIYEYLLLEICSKIMFLGSIYETGYLKRVLRGGVTGLKTGMLFS